MTAPANQLALSVTSYNEAVSLRQRNATVELELRLDTITAEEFAHLDAAAIARYGPGTHTNTVNIISDDIDGKSKKHNVGVDTVVYITMFEYVNNVKVSAGYYTKTRVRPPIRVIDYMPYRIGVSIEAPTTYYISSTNAHVRFKRRRSYVIPLGEIKWRLDLTTVVQARLTDGEAALGSLRTRMFTATTPSAGAGTDTLGTDKYVRMDEAIYEVEIELIECPGKLKVEDLRIIREIFSLINPHHQDNMLYQAEIYKIALAMGVPKPAMFESVNNRLKQLVPQVTAINKNTFRTIGDIVGYFATLKLDGERCLITVAGTACKIITSMHMMSFVADESLPGTSIADGEIVFAAGHTADTPAFTVHIFDVIRIDDERIHGDMERRIAMLPTVARIIAGQLPPPCGCVAKEYVKLTAPLEKCIVDLWAQHGVDHDGIIFSAPGKNYLETLHYKWKPTEKNTIDFSAMLCPASLLGMPPYIAAAPGKYVYLLFCGIRHDVRKTIGLGFLGGYRDIFPDPPAAYYPIQFSPSIDPLAYIWYSDIPDLHGKVVELSLEGATDCAACSWNFHRVREDRIIGSNYYGNNFYTAEVIYMNYVNSFPLEYLWSNYDTYFKKTTSTSNYRASNGYKRYVISLALEYITSPIRILDAAAGRGADLLRYRDLGTKSLLAIDIDADGISELVDRKYSSKRGGGESVYDRFKDINADKFVTRDAYIAGSMTIHTAVMDMTSPAATMLARCQRYGYTAGTATGLVCNFALHYFCGSRETLANFMQFAASVMAIGAEMIFTVMDGARVVKKLGKTTAWSIMDGDTAKYEIVRDGTGVIVPFGTYIKVRLPFSDELMREPLCFISDVLAVAAEYGLVKKVAVAFDDHLEEFATVNTSMHSELSAGDIEYIGLHTYCVLTRQELKKTGKGVKKAAASMTTPRRAVAKK